jgi:hypothetical protein
VLHAWDAFFHQGHMQTSDFPACIQYNSMCTVLQILNCIFSQYTVKKRLAIFPSPVGMSLTKLTLAGNLFHTRESLVVDIPAGDGKIANLFLQCTFFNTAICRPCVSNCVGRCWDWSSFNTVSDAEFVLIAMRT